MGFVYASSIHDVSMMCIQHLCVQCSCDGMPSIFIPIGIVLCSVYIT